MPLLLGKHDCLFNNVNKIDILQWHKNSNIQKVTKSIIIYRSLAFQWSKNCFGSRFCTSINSLTNHKKKWIHEEKKNTNEWWYLDVHIYKKCSQQHVQFQLNARNRFTNQFFKLPKLIEFHRNVFRFSPSLYRIQTKTRTHLHKTTTRPNDRKINWKETDKFGMESVENRERPHMSRNTSNKSKWIKSVVCINK